MIRVTVWNEFYHEKTKDTVRAVYPDGIHRAVAEFLGQEADFRVRTATLDEEQCGLTQEVLADTDVLIWWGHARHGDVPDEIAERVKNEVLKGMGVIFLHSAHHSKLFRSLMGTTCHLTWREDGDAERIWTVSPGHPIAQGIGRYFELPHVETYGEPFAIPNPDDVIFIGSYSGGEVFRSGVTFHRENGRIFYFQPGHETYPIFRDANVQRVICNAVRWAAPVYRADALRCLHVAKPGAE